MRSWRITKYNPIFRDETGRYLKNDWISFYDIGKSFEGKLFTVGDYIRTENLYIYAIIAFVRELHISSLRASGLEKNKNLFIFKRSKNLYSKEMLRLFNSVKDQQILSLKEVEYISKLILREQLWCKLSFEENFFVHFGYDYYMYIGTNENVKM